MSWHYVAGVWRRENPKPCRSGIFTMPKDPVLADKVADVTGPYVVPPGGAVVLSIDEKTQIQALDRTRPALPAPFAAGEKRIPDYLRNGKSLALLRKAVKPHTDKHIYVALDNFSTHTTPEMKAWLAKNPHVHFHFTPVGFRG